MVQNSLLSQHLIVLCPTSSGVSEQCGASEWMSHASCAREWTSEWPSTSGLLVVLEYNAKMFSSLFSSYSVVASYHYHGAQSEGLQTRITSTWLWSFKFAIAFTHAPPSHYFATAMECIFGCTLIDETMTITNTHGSCEKIYDFLTILYSWIVGRVLQVAYCSMVML